MRKILSLAAIVGASILAACTTPGAVPQPLTPAQLHQAIQGACPSFSAVLASLSALQGLPPEAVKDLAIANGVIPAACAAGANVSVASVQSLATTAAPALVSAINASTLQPQQKNEAILAISAGQIILSGAIAASQAAGAAPAVLAASAAK